MAWSEAWERTKEYLREAAEDKIGMTVLAKERLEVLEAVEMDYRNQSRQLDLIGWHVLDYMSGSPHEVKPRKRREAAQQARLAWMYDPMAGRATDLMNDFVFGRGVPPPRARNENVQKVLDSAWKDPDNVAVLTGFMAQVKLGTDLSLQSNLFILIFDDGEDGKVKLGLLDHDTVFDAVRDPENRLRVLYYVAHHTETEWDYDNDCLKIPDVKQDLTKQVRYYAHWKNLKDAEDDAEAGLRPPVKKPPAEKIGDGRVYHIAVNSTTEMVFGVPMMQRTLRWFSAYNDLMSARVDMAKAAAELIMKRKVKGSPAALARMATQALSRGGEIATTPDPTRVGARPASTVTENENVTHEAFKLDSGAGNAKEDATMIRSQVSAGTGLPQHYLGDQGNANLATATAMDLPVTKMVEGRQELFEQLFRAFCDLVIYRAVEKGQLEGDLPGEEDAEVTTLSSIGEAAIVPSKIPMMPVARQIAQGGHDNGNGNGNGNGSGNGNGKGKGRGKKKVDLSYEFKMPNPLRRLMQDLVAAIQTIAKTFDPNGTNVELSRTLLAIALGEAMEMQDPADAVDRIFPPGYVDPLVAMELANAQAPPAPPGDGSGAPVDPNAGGAPGSGTQAAGGEPGSGKAGPYGTKSGAPGDMQQGYFEALVDAAVELAETRFSDLPPDERAAAEARLIGMSDEFDDIVGRIADEVVRRVPVLPPA